MLSKKQSELSAAEVCLRSLGYLPNVTVEDYTIQPYRGGTNSIIELGFMLHHQRPDSYLKLIARSFNFKRPPNTKVKQITGIFNFHGIHNNYP